MADKTSNQVSVLLTAFAMLLFVLGLATPKASAQTTTIYSDNFEGAVTGWSNNSVDASTGFTRFLGRFNSSRRDTSRTFTMPPDTTQLVITFDFYEIDSWDGDEGDSFETWINGTRIFSLPFWHRGRQGRDGNDAMRSGTTGNVAWRVEPLTDNMLQFGFSSWEDQKHRVTLTITNPAPSVVLLLRAAVNQTDESAGYDNMTVVATHPAVAGLSATKSVRVHDPDGLGLYAVPGVDMVYAFELVNEGSAVDPGSIVITDRLPQNVELYTGSFAPSSTPFRLVETGPSGLSCCNSAQIDYSATLTGLPVWGYVPLQPYDPAVKAIRIRPGGTMASGLTTPNEAAIEFRVRVK